MCVCGAEEAKAARHDAGHITLQRTCQVKENMDANSISRRVSPRHDEDALFYFVVKDQQTFIKQSCLYTH